MKLTLFDGCIGFGVNIDDIRIPDDDIETRKAILHKIIDFVEDPIDLQFILKDFTTILEANMFESNLCKTCGEYNEYGEYEIDGDCVKRLSDS